jgi:hypothetical protein
MRSADLAEGKERDGQLAIVSRFVWMQMDWWSNQLVWSLKQQYVAVSKVFGSISQHTAVPGTSTD